MEEPPKEFKMKMADWILKFNAPGTYEGYLPIARLAWEWMQNQGKQSSSINTEMLEALKAVVKVADRKTAEFDMARAAIAKAQPSRDRDTV